MMRSRLPPERPVPPLLTDQVRYRYLLPLALAVIVAAGLLLESLTVMTAGPVVLGLSAVEGRRRRSEAAERRANVLLPGVVDQLIQDLRAGLSLRQGCERLGTPAPSSTSTRAPIPPLPGLAVLSAELQAGATLRDAAERLARSQDSSMQLVAVTLLVLTRSGGPAVPALQRLRHTLMGVVNVRQQAASEASQSLASASLLVAAPAIFACAVAALEPSAADLYLYEPIGAACVLAAVALSYLGWWWIQRAVINTIGRTL